MIDGQEQSPIVAVEEMGTTSSRAVLKRGTVLVERYEVNKVLGLGGMSTVYAARDLRFATTFKPCAVKEMADTTATVSDRQQLLANFEREANLLASLSHPAIPKVFDYFVNGKQVYLVLEFVRGHDLETVLNQATQILAESTVVDWALQIIDVLHYLHNHKPTPIVFRDLKPSNVMLSDSDRVVLIDFGIAKAFQSGRKGTMIGTEGYCPPEQYRGMSEPRGDIYSLGAMMHHLLTRSDPRLEPPFTFHERPPRVLNSAISIAVEATIMKALSYDPDERYNSVAEMKAALLAARPSTATSISTLSSGTVSPPVPLATTSPMSPAAGGVTATVTSAPAAVAAATASGEGEGQVELRWRFETGDEVRSTPALAGKMLYVGSYDANLYALNAGKGTLAWQFTTEGGICGAPAVQGDLVIVPSEDHTVYAVDTTTHQVRWSLTTEGPVRSSPRVDGDRVYVGSDDGYVYAVRLIDGEEEWKTKTWRPVRSSPVIAGGLLYIGSEDQHLYALDIETGAVKWKFQTLRGVTSSPIVHDGFVYVGSMDSHLYAFDAEMGWLVWKFKTNHYIVSSPRLKDGVIVFGSVDGAVYGVEARSGRQLWRYITGGQITSTPAIQGDKVIVTGVDGTVLGLTLKTGKRLWSFKAGGPIPGSPIVIADAVFFGCNDGSVYAITASARATSS